MIDDHNKHQLLAADTSFFFVQAMRSEGRDIDIGDMMDRWTLQMGYPVVTISKNQSEQLPTHHITVSQEHFLYGQEVRNDR